MKKLLVVLGMLVLNVVPSFGANLTANTVSSAQTTCDGGTRSETYYVGKTNTRYFYDNLRGDQTKHYIIGFSSSFVNVYNPYGVLDFQNGGAFAFKSEIKPRGLDEVIVVHQNQGAGTNIINHAPNRGDIAAQLVYNIKRKIESGTQATTTTYQYMKTDKSTATVSTNAAWSSAVTSDNECFNVYVGWCGDGVIDNGSTTVYQGKATTNGLLAGGEVCDDGAANGQPGKCKADCSGTSTQPAGNLTIAKTSNKETYTVGEQVTFTITVNNPSTQPVTNIVVKDVLPTELTYVSNPDGGSHANGTVTYPAFSLNAGQSKSFTLVATYSVYKASVINNVNFTAVSNGTNLNGSAQKQIYCTQPTGYLVVEKVLTTDKQYNVGDTVQFRINISNPSTQTVSNISIEDILPAGLQYVSSNIYGVNGPVYASSGTVQGAYKIVYSGFSLNAGQNGYILINVKLYNCTSTINNVIWSASSNGQALQGYTNKKVDCTVLPLSLVKAVNPTSTELGGTVRYTITATNSTQETLTNVSLDDVWPTCLSLAGTPSINYPAQQSQNGTTTTWKLTSSIAPGAVITVSFDGKSSTDASCVGSHVNTARLTYTDSQGTKKLETTATVTLTTKPQVTIDKTIVQLGSGPGDIMKYRIIYKNTGTTPIVGYTIRDVWPTTLSFESSTPAPRNSSERPLIRDFSASTLQPGEEKYIEVIGKISTTETVTQISNTACIKPTNGNEICDTEITTLNQPACVSLDVQKSGTRSIVATCRSQYAFGNTAWTVECGGDGGTKSGYVPSSQSFSTVCSYSTSEIANNAMVVCKIAGNTNNSCRKNLSSSCDLSVNPKVVIVEDNDSRSVEVTCSANKTAALQIDCGNGRKSSTRTDYRITHTCEYDDSDIDYNQAEAIKKISCSVDGITNSCQDDVIISKGFIGICGNGVREGSEQCDGGGYRGQGERRGETCKVGCTLGDDAAQCLSVHNGNISIEKGEYLPFWWAVYEDSFASTANCSNSSDRNKIIKSSMECTFELQKPGKVGQQETKEILKTQCIKNPTYKIFNFFEPLIKTNTTKYAIWKYAVAPSIFDNWVGDEVGEYKLRLKEIDYSYCDENLEKQESQTNNVCETDFAITKPYLVQKSAFGAFPKATDIDLSRFYDINGNNITTRTDLADIMVLDKNDYVSRDVNVIVNSFVAKAEKLATTIPTAKLPQYLKDMKVTVKKVPNKDIYILYGSNNAWLNLSKNATLNVNKPFTMIVKNANLVVNGNTNVNGMFIVPNGTIKFDTDDCSRQQIVKGIFVAKTFSAQKYANDSLNKEWCNGGGLYVKGVLIGDGVDTLVNNKRSTLSSWFKVNGTEKAIKTQRRNMIFNGASVLIEYSPDLWQNLPPGAEDFTKLLEVYKK